jgi:hypothetical protein
LLFGYFGSSTKYIGKNKTGEINLKNRKLIKYIFTARCARVSEFAEKRYSIAFAETPKAIDL